MKFAFALFLSLLEYSKQQFLKKCLTSVKKAFKSELILAFIRTESVSKRPYSCNARDGVVLTLIQNKREGKDGERKI